MYVSKTISDFNNCVTKKIKCFGDCDKIKKLKKYARSFATENLSENLLN